MKLELTVQENDAETMTDRARYTEDAEDPVTIEKLINNKINKKILILGKWKLLRVERQFIMHIAN